MVRISSSADHTAFAGSTRISTSPNGKEAESTVDRFWFHDEFLAAHLPEPRILIEGFLVAGTAANWHGPGGVGKTWAALEAARAIASGRPFLGRFATTQGRVLLIDQESHPAKLQERLAALNAGSPLPPEANRNLLLILTSGLYVDDGEDDEGGGYAKLRDWIGACRPDLLILDSFTRAHRSEENNAGAMADVNLRLRWLMDEFGIAVLLIDHANKMGVVGGAADPTTRLRGSTEKLNFVDSALFFERRKVAPGITVGDKALSPTIDVTVTKSRWMESPPPFTIELRNEDGAIRLAYAGDRAADQSSRPGEVVAAILELQKQQGADASTKAHIAAYLEVAERTIERQLRVLKDAGLIRERSRPKKAGERGRGMNVYDVVETP